MTRGGIIFAMPTAEKLIGAQTANELADAIRAESPKQKLPALESAAGQLEGLPLRQRSDLLRDALLVDIGQDYQALASIIRKAAAGDESFKGWMMWPVTSAVAESAVADGEDEALDDALQLLRELTPRLSSEFAIRSLLRKDLDRALETIIGAWLVNSDEHVRRLASEGTRPYLPWAVRVPGILQNPECTVPILDALYRDDSEYVRRSVANHLNDLSRDHSELVVEIAGRWMSDPDVNTQKVVSHGLRTLIKKGNPAALELMGFSAANISATDLKLDKSVVVIGDAITFSAELTNAGESEANLAIDYVVHHRKANRKTTGKVFKLAVRKIAPDAETVVEKKHSFRVISTRRYYPGIHAIELMANGVSVGQAEFELVADEVTSP